MYFTADMTRHVVQSAMHYTGLVRDWVCASSNHCYSGAHEHAAHYTLSHSLSHFTHSELMLTFQPHMVVVKRLLGSIT